MVAASDSARRALADEANWPAWLTREAAGTLPEGVDRVYWDGTVISAFPAPWHTAEDQDWHWTHRTYDEDFAIAESSSVYHLPPAAKGEGDAKPDAGRAEGVIGAAVQDHLNRCAAPKPSPGEVAEDDYTRWVQYRDSFKHAPTRVRPTERDLFNSFALTLRERSPIGH